MYPYHFCLTKFLWEDLCHFISSFLSVSISCLAIFFPSFPLAYPYVLLGFLDGEFDIPPQGFSLLFWLPTLPLANILLKVTAWTTWNLCNRKKFHRFVTHVIYNDLEWLQWHFPCTLVVHWLIRFSLPTHKIYILSLQNTYLNAC